VNTIVLLGLAVGVGAPALKEKTPPLVGEWVVESAIYNGARMAFKDHRCDFAADGSFRMYRAGEKSSSNTTYSVDMSTDPASFTFRYKTDKPGDLESLGIYKVEGDTLNICYARPGSVQRPVAFESPKDSGINLIILKRAKPKD
jgi:uncharacterized protein (TIGR03067 family)